MQPERGFAFCILNWAALAAHEAADSEVQAAPVPGGGEGVWILPLALHKAPHPTYQRVVAELYHSAYRHPLRLQPEPRADATSMNRTFCPQMPQISGQFLVSRACETRRLGTSHPP